MECHFFKNIFMGNFEFNTKTDRKQAKMLLEDDSKNGYYLKPDIRAELKDAEKRKTLKTFKDEKLLPKRINIVLTRNPEFTKEGAVILHSEEELSKYQEEHPEETIFLIGGAEVYNSMIGICDEAIITYIHKTFEADAYFPNLDELEDWEMDEEEDEIVDDSWSDPDVISGKIAPDISQITNGASNFLMAFAEAIGRFKYIQEENVEAEYEKISAELKKQLSDAADREEDF